MGAPKRLLPREADKLQLVGMEHYRRRLLQLWQLRQENQKLRDILNSYKAEDERISEAGRVASLERKVTALSKQLSNAQELIDKYIDLGQIQKMGVTLMQLPVKDLFELSRNDG